MSKRLPIVLSIAALGLAVALPGVAVSAEDRADPVGVECTAETPAVKKVVDAVKSVEGAAADPAKLQVVLGDVYKGVTEAQEEGCLPTLPGSSEPPASPDRAVDACLAPTVDLLSAVLAGISATLKTPPDPTATTTAVTKLATAIKAFNAAKCLPVELPVPGGVSTPPLPPTP